MPRTWRWTIAGLWLVGCQGPTADETAGSAARAQLVERPARAEAPEPAPQDAAARAQPGEPTTRGEAPGSAPQGAAATAGREQPAAAATPEPGLPPLSADQRAALLAGPEERIISRREHFTVSNEYRHDLWFPYLRGLGGVYVGVASDQNYTLMAVAGSEVGYLIDLDRQVVHLHRMYMALIATSPAPDEFLARFDAANHASTVALLEAGLSDMSEGDRAAALKFLAANREALRAYLGTVHASERDGQGVTWLSDPALYEHMRRMVAGGRLRPINGNLAGKTAMATIAAGARALELPVKVLYLSNAEEYLFYTPDFVANVRALPVEPDSIVLRTIHDRFVGWESSGDGDKRWNYQVQPLVDFQTRLADRKNNARTQMLAHAEKAGAIARVARGVSVFKPSTSQRPIPTGDDARPVGDSPRPIAGG